MNDELFGRYTLEDARRDSEAAYEKYLTRNPQARVRHMTLPPHITIVDNDPLPDCGWCDGTGTVTWDVFKDKLCPCRHLGRQPLTKEVIES